MSYVVHVVREGYQPVDQLISSYRSSRSGVPSRSSMGAWRGVFVSVRHAGIGDCETRYWM
jgi:hypothetical protein